jgi:hypothetical protein
MDRNATSTVLTEIGKSKNFPVHLLDIYFDNGRASLTDAYKDIEFGTVNYTATGHFLGFDAIEETTELVVQKLNISLSGVDQTYISTVLGGQYIDRKVALYLGFLDENTEQLIDEPILIFDGRMDQPNISEDPSKGTCTITVSCTNAWVDFERRPMRRTNHAEQQIHFAGDKGFEFASEVTKEILWGRT